MSTILAQMRAEHQQITKVLQVLEQELTKFESGDDVNFDLMQTIVGYIAEYPNQVHHPKEDLVYGHLVLIDHESEPVVEQLKQEHRNLAQITHVFSNTLQEVAVGAVLPRTEVAKQAYAFVQANFAHIQLEESKVFPRVMASFSATDWATVSNELPTKEDPLFGGLPAEEFELLYEEIMGAVEVFS